VLPVDVKDGFQLWSETYSRRMKDVFAIQEEIARQVVDALQVTFAFEKRSASYAPNPDAFHLYLKARYQANKRTQESLRKTVELFQQALSSDPSYASAYAGMAEAYALLASGGYATSGLEEMASRSKAAVSKAIELDPSLGEAHAALALVHFRLDWNWESGEREFRLACALNPSFATAHHWFALYLAAMGRPGDALAAIRRAQELDPLSLIINTAAARVLHFGARYDAAIAQCQKVLEMEPNFVEAHLDLGMAYLEKRRASEAIHHLERSVQLSPERVLLRALLGHAYGRIGNREAAMRVLNDLNSIKKPHNALSLHRAFVLTGLGQKVQALEQLERALEERAGPIVYLKVEPMWASLRAHARFKKLLDRLRL
jgi:tetratricopeptide (TPR) repeat protein